jgi:anti-anti-sigma factor
MEVTKVHDISVLHLFGEVSLMELDQIERVLNSLKKSKNHKVILDMTSVDHIHYLVVKRLVENAINLRSQNGDLKLVNINDDAKHIIRFTGADQYLEDYATISEGILSFLKQVSMDPESFQ